MILLSIILILLQCYISFKRPVNGLAMFMAVRILVPECMRSPVPALSLNSMMIVILLMSTFVKQQFNPKKVVNDRFGRTLMVFVFLPFLVLPFSDYMDLGAQYKNWIQTFLTDYTPAFLALMIIRKKSDIDTLLRVFIVSGLVSMVYGVFSFATNSNPYFDMVTSVSSYTNVGGDEVENIYDKFMRSTSSTFVSINAYGYFLTYFFALLLLLQKKMKKPYFIGIALFCIFSIILSSKRSPLIVLFGIVAYIIKDRRRLIIPIVGVLGIGIILLFTLPQFEYLKNIFLTAVYFWDDSVADKVGVSGSSMELRINQTFYPFTEIKDNLLFGHGFGWCGTYLSQNKHIHPILYGFETLTSGVVCELGLVGLYLYWKLFRNAYLSIKRYRLDKKINYALLYILAVFLLYIATAQNYLFFFLITIIIIHKATLVKGYSVRPLFDLSLRAKKRKHKRIRHEQSQDINNNAGV